MRTQQIKRLRLTKTPSDGSGTFEGTIDFNPPEGDYDGERIDNWINLPTTVPLGYQHAYGDIGAEIGSVKALDKDGRHMLVLGRLNIGHNPMADAIYERMLMPSSHPLAMRELSVGFTYSAEKSYKEPGGVSVVHQGAQATSITNVKVAHQGGTVVMDESDLDGLPAQRRDDIPVPFHVEARGAGYSVIDESTGQPVNTYHTRAEAVARLVEIRANLNPGKSANHDPAFMRHKIEAAAEGRDLTPEDFTREKQAERQAERRRPVVSNEVLSGDTITSLTTSSWNTEPDPAEGETFRVEFPIVED
jgi:hypothetical protein